MSMEWRQLLNANRRRQTSVPSDQRLQFERDFDRCVFSTPVRRLQDKAQVFPLEPHDAVRTRLTHSLEVSSVARGLATKVAKWLLDERHDIDPGMDRQIEVIAATCGLLHDLGNPPFGHAGEAAIQEWFKRYNREDRLRNDLDGREQLVQDFLKFEGNAQTLRLVAKLQIMADEYGLNLTFGTLSALCKYIVPSDEAGTARHHASTKPGYFASENKLVEEIRGATGTGAARNPITYLVEAADDIVYSVADIEDAIKKGVFGWDWLEKRVGGVAGDSAPEVMRRKVNILAGGRSEPPAELPDDIHAAAFRTASIGILVDAAAEAFKLRYGEIMEGTYTGELVAEGPTKDLIECFKRIGREKIYCTHQTLKLELLGRRVIQDLMDLFWEGASALPAEGPPKPKDFPGKLGALLSEGYRRVFRDSLKGPASDLPEPYRRFQLMTDYVCGMTDSFAKRLHAELTNGQA